MSYIKELREIMVANLVKARKEKGLSQRNLAKILGVSYGFLSLIETGRRPIPENLLDKIKHSLGLNMAQLLNKPSDEGYITPSTVWSFFEELPEDVRRKTYEVLMVFARSDPEERDHIYQDIGQRIYPQSKLTELSLTDRLKLADWTKKGEPLPNPVQAIVIPLMEKHSRGGTAYNEGEYDEEEELVG